MSLKQAKGTNFPRTIVFRILFLEFTNCCCFPKILAGLNIAFRNQNCVWLRMTRMEMECNLKTSGSFYRVCAFFSQINKSTDLANFI